MPEVIRVAVRDEDMGDFIVTMIDEIVERAELIEQAVRLLRNWTATVPDVHPVVDDTASIMATFAGKVRQAFSELELAGELVKEAHGVCH